MERQDVIKRLIYKYIDNNSPYKVEALTKYVGVDIDKVNEDKDKIIDGYLSNVFICGDSALYDTLRYAVDHKAWINIYDKKSLELFEYFIAVGIAAGIFVYNIGQQYIEYMQMSKNELKYLLPEEFEYIDENYYEGLDKYIIKKLYVDINTEIYNRTPRTHTVREIINYWWTHNNIPNASEHKGFYYLLDTDESGLLDVITYLYCQGSNPLTLLFELDHKTHSNLIVKVKYILNSMNEDDKLVFNTFKQDFLNVYDRILSQEERGLGKKKEL